MENQQESAQPWPSDPREAMTRLVEERMALLSGFDAQHIVGGIEAGTSIDVMRQTQMAAGLFLLGFSSSEKMPPFLKAPGSHAKSAAEASLACYR